LALAEWLHTENHFPREDPSQVHQRNRLRQKMLFCASRICLEKMKALPQQQEARQGASKFTIP